MSEEHWESTHRPSTIPEFIKFGDSESANIISLLSIYCIGEAFHKLIKTDSNGSGVYVCVGPLLKISLIERVDKFDRDLFDCSTHLTYLTMTDGLQQCDHILDIIIVSK